MNPKGNKTGRDDKTGRDERHLRNEAEAEQARERAAAEASQRTDAILHELQVHQIELEMQNEALRQSQIQLEESRDRYLDLYDFAPIGYLTLSNEGLIAEINLTGAALLGEVRGRLINRRFARFVMAGDHDRWHQHFMRTRQQGGKQSCEMDLQRADGTVFNARLDCLPRTEGASSPMRVALADITDHKQAEEKLRIAAIAFESQVGMMVTDADGIILQINQAFTRITGFEAVEALGKTLGILKSGCQDQAFYRDMWDTLKREKCWQGEIWNRHRDGRLFAEWLTISAVAAPDGRVTHYVGSFSDITRHLEAEAEKRDAQKALEAAREQLFQAQKLEAVGLLTGGVAHDFNNLLTVVIGNLDLLKDVLKGEAKGLRLVGNALIAAERGAEVTSRLLAFARRQILNPQTIEIDEAIRHGWPLFERAVGETIRLVSTTEPDLWSCRIDPNQLETALLNLCINARDAMPGGGKLTIAASNAALPAAEAAKLDLEPGDYIRIAVTDSGTGMPPEVAAMAFDPFFTTKEVGKGTGLGLSQVYGFARQSGGAAVIDSMPGEGTTVALLLPRTVGMDEHAGAEPREKYAPEQAPAGKEASGRTILIVEDEPNVLAMTEAYLRELGYKTLSAGSGGEALDIVSTGVPIDLLFSDIVLPGGMNGPELAQIIQQRQPNLKILLTSGYPGHDWGKHASGDAFEIFAKPYRMQALVAKIDSMLHAEGDGG